MATRDFRSSQVRTTQIIASGSDTTSKPSLLIYSASAATNDQGAVIAKLLDNVGEDAWLFISGSKNPVHGHKAQVLFGGSVVLSGTLSGSAFSAMPGQSFTLSSDDNINFVIDKDGNSTSSFSFKSGATEVANINESGTLQLDGTLDVDGGGISVTAANDAAATILMQADNSDDAGDDWQIGANTNQTFTIGNDIASAGTPVTHLSITPNATVTDSTVNVAGNLDVGNTLTVPQDIVHAGDTNTKITFGTREVKITADNFDVAKATDASFIINENNANLDFEVRGDGDNIRAIHVDASEDTIKFLHNDSAAIAEKDVNFLVNSPGLGLKNTNTRGVALFKGDVVVSGTLYADKQVLEVDLVQSGSNLILSSSLHFQNSGAGAGSSFAVPANDGAIFVTTGSLIAKLADAGGNTTEVKIGQNYIAGDGLTSTIANPNTTFHASIAAISGSAMGATDIATGDLFAVADVDADDSITKKITAADLVTNLSQNGIRQATGADAPGFQTDDGIVAHLSGSVFTGLVGITGSNNISLTTINRVGVGVSDPDAKLEVLDTGTQLKLSYDADTFATLAVGSNGDLTLATKESNSDIVFQVDDAGSEFTALKIDGANAGSAAFTPASGGGVSITPTGDNAIAEIDGGEITLTKASGTGTVAPTITFKKSKGVIGGQTKLTDGVTIGNILFDGFDDASATSAAITVKADGDHGDDTTDAPGQMIFSTTPNGTDTLTSRMVIRQDGKVGIGVDSPTDTLDVNGDIRVRGNDIKDSAGDAAITFDGSGNTEITGDLTVTGADVTVGADADGSNRTIVFGHSTLKSVIGIHDSQDVFAINTDAAFQVVNDFEIDSAGNVTLGTGTLQVGGNVIKASDGGSTITMDADDNVTIAGDLTVSGGDIAGPADNDLTIKSDGNITFRIDGDNDETGQSFAFQNNTSTEIANIDESGNLQIDGDLTVSGNNIKGAGGSPGITFDGTGNTAIDGNLKVTGNVIQASDGGSTITMDTNDNVTIAGDLTVTGNDIKGSAGTNLTLGGSGLVEVAGILQVPSTIEHTGDDNTKITFDTDDITVTAGGKEGISVTASGVVINDANDSAVDFRVESDNNQHAIFVDASKDQVLINSASVNGTDVAFFVSGSDGVVNSSKNHGGVSLFSGDVVISGSLFDGNHNRINLISISENGTFSSGQNASGTNSVAIGQNAAATGTSAIAIGQNSAAGGSTGHSIVAGGLDNTASGDYAAVLGGQSNTASGDYAAAIGRSNNVSGEDSVAIGKSLTVSSDNTIAIGNNSNNADVQIKGTLNAAGNVTLDDSASLLVPDSIIHKGDTNTFIQFDTDQIKLDTAGATRAHLTSTQVLIMSQSGHSDDFNAQNAADVNFYVMGRKNSKDTTTAGTSVFGGDVHISGSLSGPSQYALTDNSVRMFRDGSTMKFVDGVTSVKTLEQLASVAVSPTFFIGTEGDSSTRSRLKTTASIAFAGDLNANLAEAAVIAAGAGSDVYFFVSGSVEAKDGATRHVSLFGGDTVISGSTHVTSLTGSAIISTGNLVASGSLIAGGNVIKNSNGDSSIRFNSTDAGVFIGSQFDTAAQSLLDIRKDDNTTLTSGVDGNTLANFNLALRNHSTTENAFAGIAFDVANEQDIDRIGASVAGVRRTTDADNHKTDLVFSTNAGDDSGGVDDGLTEALRITSDGKVGIGVTNPSRALDVNGDVMIRGNDILDSGGNVIFSFDGSGNLDIVGNVTQATTQFTDVNISGGDLIFGNGQNATIDVDDVSGTNTAGKNLSILAGAGTGTGVGGQLEFKVAPAGSSGTSVNSHSTILTLPSTGVATFGGSIQIPNGDSIRNGDGENVITIDANQNVTVAGDLTVSGNDIKDSGGGTVLTFDGSQNTTLGGGLSFPSTQGITGSLRTEKSSDVIFSANAGGLNIDKSHAFFLDASVGKIGIGTANPTSKLHIVTDQNAGGENGGDNSIVMETVNASNNGAFIFRRAAGTIGSETAAGNSAKLGSIVFEGHDGTDFEPAAAIRGEVSYTSSGNNDMPGLLSFLTTADGASSLTERAVINHDGQLIVNPNGTWVGQASEKLLVRNDWNAGNTPISQFGIYNGASNRLEVTVDPTGNVGFGFSHASNDQLAVSGSLKVEQALELEGPIIGNGATNIQINHTGADGDDGLLIIRADTSTVTNDLLGGIGFDSTDGNVPSSITEASAFIAGYAAESHGTGDKGGYLVFGTSAINDNDDTVSTEHMRIRSSGLVQTTANIMIGGNEIKASDGTTAITLNSTDATIAGNLKVGSNIIQASDGGSTITMDTSDNVTIGNDLTVGGNVIRASDGGSTITMDTSDNVTIGGDLTVTGGDVIGVNLKLDASGDITLSADGDQIKMDDGSTTRFTFNVDSTPELDVTGAFIIDGSSTITIDAASSITLDAVGDITLDAAGDDIIFKDAGTTRFTFNLDSTPELDVEGDFTIDCTGEIILDSATDIITLKGNGSTFCTFSDEGTGFAIDLEAPRSGGADNYMSNIKNTTASNSADVLKLDMSYGSSPTTSNMFIGFFTSNGRAGRIAGDGSGGISFVDAFTGAHPSVMPTSQATEKGLIVQSTGEMWAKSEISVGVDTGIPKVELTDASNSKKVYGVISKIHNESHDLEEYGYQGYINRWGVESNETHVVINSLGEGQVLVTNINGNIENGDYISSSDISGYGQKQADDVLRNFTVAKCVENVDWDSVTETIEHNGTTYKKYLVACTYHCG